MLLIPSMQIIPGRRQSPVEVLVGEARDRGAASLCRRAAVVDRLVRPSVEEQRAAAGQHRDHRHVDVGDGRQDQTVLGPEELGELGLDLLVEDRAAEQARPARVRAPPGQVLGNGRDDLLVEVEPEVVA
jgi:hypothetical protein